MNEYIYEEWSASKRILLIIFCLAGIYMFYGFGEYLLVIIGMVCTCTAIICYILQWYFNKINKLKKVG